MPNDSKNAPARSRTEGLADGRALPADPPQDASHVAREIGGPRGPEPTRYGDWERKGRCIDF